MDFSTASIAWCPRWSVPFVGKARFKSLRTLPESRNIWARRQTKGSCFSKNFAITGRPTSGCGRWRWKYFWSAACGQQRSRTEWDSKYFTVVEELFPSLILAKGHQPPRTLSICSLWCGWSTGKAINFWVFSNVWSGARWLTPNLHGIPSPNGNYSANLHTAAYPKTPAAISLRSAPSPLPKLPVRFASHCIHLQARRASVCWAPSIF